MEVSTQKKTSNSNKQTSNNLKLPASDLSRLQSVWKQAYAAEDSEDLRRLYEEWADLYDADHELIGFRGHIEAAKLLAKHISAPPENAMILDAGAGTGAAGVALNRLGFQQLTAMDLSADMLTKAQAKNVYKLCQVADFSLPIDTVAANMYDAAIMVGFFSYGQAPAIALEEIVRMVKPGGIVVFTMRMDFFEQDPMDVRSKIESLTAEGSWELVEQTQPELYLPKIDPDAKYAIWCYRVTPVKIPAICPELVEAVQEAFTSDSPVKRLDHRHIWNTQASRLYNAYIQQPEYYLNDCETEILQTYANSILGEPKVVVELGCGSADKVRHLLEVGSHFSEDHKLTYVPIDISEGAIEATQAEVNSLFQDTINVVPIQGTIQQAIPKMAEYDNKVLLFFGSSIGNLESIEETIHFLELIRKSLTPTDRFVVGTDLAKDEEVLRKAYMAGEPNRLFFLNMVRRLNNELGANFHLHEFVQDSTDDDGEPYDGIRNRSVNFKLKTKIVQDVYLRRIGIFAHLNAGDSIQVGTSRKYRKEDIHLLAEKAGLRLRNQWVDRRGYFALNELVLPEFQES